jgi:hypothetical protein
MMKARSQVAKRIDRYWLHPLLCAPKPARRETARKSLRACISKLPTVEPLQESDPIGGQRAFSYKTSTDLLH